MFTFIEAVFDGGQVDIRSINSTMKMGCCVVPFVRHTDVISS